MNPEDKAKLRELVKDWLQAERQANSLHRKLIGQRDKVKTLLEGMGRIVEGRHAIRIGRHLYVVERLRNGAAIPIQVEKLEVV